MVSVLLVYHEPGVKGSERLLERLVESLSELGIAARLEPLGRGVESKCWGYRNVYLLMMGRGGHWLELRDACGAPAKTIPAWVTAKSIADLLSARGLRSVLLLYRRAKRNIDVYSRDLAGIGFSLRARGYKVAMIEAGIVERVQIRIDAVVPLTLLPGRLLDIAVKAGRLYSAAYVAPYFAAYGLEEIVAWISGDVFSRSSI